MRLIGIGFLAFLLAGIAILLSSSAEIRVFSRQVSEIFTGPQLRFEPLRDMPLAEGQFLGTVTRSAPIAPIILSGFPSYQSATFHLPVNVRPISGHLEIEATTQIRSGAGGLLRISIGGRKRGEILLRPGDSKHRVIVDLFPHEVAQQTLVVAFSLLGEGPNSTCSIDSGFDSVVEIEPSSAVHLTFEQPLASLQDRVLSTGLQTRLAWNEDQTSRVSSLLAGARLQRRGYLVSYATDDPALSVTEMSRLNQVSDPPQISTDLHEFAWSDIFRPRSSVFGLRKFRQRQTWRIQYEMGMARNLHLPDRLNLEMSLGQQASGHQWQVAVALNGRLVKHELFSNDISAVRMDIPLPADAHRIKNMIEVIATSTRSSSGKCDLGPELFAEITPATNMVAGRRLLSEPLFDLQAELVRQTGWILRPDRQLSVADAQVAAGMLAEILPEELPAGPSTSPSILHVLPPDSDYSAQVGGASGNVWIIHRNIENDRVRIVPVADYRRVDTDGVYLLAVLSGSGK